MGAVLSMMGTAYSAYSGYQQGKQQAKIAEQNAQQSAKYAQQQTEIETQRRSSERSSQQEQQRRRRALQEASYAKSGVLLEGTPADYLTEQAETDALNVAQADQDSEQRIKGYLFKGQMGMMNAMNEADAYSSASSASLLAGGLKVGETGAIATHKGAFSWMDSPASTTANYTGSFESPNLLDTNRSMYA
jgi:hypothetical protein